MRHRDPFLAHHKRRPSRLGAGFPHLSLFRCDILAFQSGLFLCHFTTHETRILARKGGGLSSPLFGTVTFSPFEYAARGWGACMSSMSRVLCRGSDVGDKEVGSGKEVLSLMGCPVAEAWSGATSSGARSAYSPAGSFPITYCTNLKAVMCNLIGRRTFKARRDFIVLRFFLK